MHIVRTTVSEQRESENEGGERGRGGRKGGREGERESEKTNTKEGTRGLEERGESQSLRGTATYTRPPPAGLTMPKHAEETSGRPTGAKVTRSPV